MNEHRAPGNVQATAPEELPIKNNTLGTTAAPMKNNTLGATAAMPMKNNTLGATAAMPMKNNTLGAMAAMPVKSNKPGTARPTSPLQAEVLPENKKQTKPGYYHPGGHMADYSQMAMQPAGYYPTSMPQMDMLPSTMPQTGMVPSARPQTGMEMPYTGMPAPVPQRSIFQPPSPQGQEMMPMNGTQRTSIMTSGLGVRDSVLTATDFTQGFLRTQIGRHVKIEFLLGTNMLIDREGDLVKVGTDYLIIQETETDDYLLCDIYSIRFIRFYY